MKSNTKLPSQPQSPQPHQQDLGNKVRQQKYRQHVQSLEKFAQNIILSSSQKPSEYKQRKPKNQQPQIEQNRNYQTHDFLFSHLQKRFMKCFSSVLIVIQKMKQKNIQNILTQFDQDFFKNMMFYCIFFIASVTNKKKNQQLNDSVLWATFYKSFQTFLSIMKQSLLERDKYLIILWTIFGEIITQREVFLSPDTIAYFQINSDQFRTVDKLQKASPYYRDHHIQRLIIIYLQQLFKYKPTASQNAILKLFLNYIKSTNQQNYKIYEILFYLTNIISGENRQQQVVKILENDKQLGQKINKLTDQQLQLFKIVSGTFEKSLNKDNLNYIIQLNKIQALSKERFQILIRRKISMNAPYEKKKDEKSFVLCFMLLCKMFDLQYMDDQNKSNDLSSKLYEQFETYKNLYAYLQNILQEFKITFSLKQIEKKAWEMIKQRFMIYNPDKIEYLERINKILPKNNDLIQLKKYLKKILLLMFMKNNSIEYSGIYNQNYYDQIQKHILNNDYKTVTYILETRGNNNRQFEIYMGKIQQEFAKDLQQKNFCQGKNKYLNQQGLVLSDAHHYFTECNQRISKNPEIHKQFLGNNNNKHKTILTQQSLFNKEPIDILQLIKSFILMFVLLEQRCIYINNIKIEGFTFSQNKIYLSSLDYCKSYSTNENNKRVNEINKEFASYDKQKKKDMVLYILEYQKIEIKQNVQDINRNFNVKFDQILPTFRSYVQPRHKKAAKNIFQAIFQFDKKNNIHIFDNESKQKILSLLSDDSEFQSIQSKIIQPVDKLILKQKQKIKEQKIIQLQQ